MRELVIAVDVGSSSARAGVFDVRGLLLARADASFAKDIPALSMREARNYATPGHVGSRTSVYEMSEGGPAAELHVAVEPNLPVAEPGAGGAHHVAFRIPDEDYEAWAERLQSLGLPSSGPIDRFYFRSLYFKEPNGILIEIATDGPGFAMDEPLEKLGEKLSLPPFLEQKRPQIEAGLRPL